MLRSALVLVPSILAAQTSWGPDEVRSTNRLYELPPPITLRVQSNLVEIGVVVRDARGHVVGGLQRTDFKIFDERKEQEITAFSVDLKPSRIRPVASANSPVEPEKPALAERSVVLFFDDFSTAAGDLARTKLAARRFVNEALDPGDRVAIVTSSAALSLDFTSDASKILEAVGRVSSHVRVSENGIAPCPRITPYQAYLIVNHDPTAHRAAVDEAYVCEHGPPPPVSLDPAEAPQLFLSVQAQSEATWQKALLASQETLIAIDAALDRLSRARGTRMLVLASSGFLGATLEVEQDRIIEHAIRASVVIHALDAKGLYAESGRPSNTVGGGDLPISTFIFEQTSVGGRLMETGAAMANLAESTGGLFLHNNNDLDASLQSLVPETTYRLGFVPARATDDGKYHTLKVRLVRPGSQHVLARPGYFMPPPVKPSEPQRNIDRIAANSDELAGLPVRIVAEPAPGALRVTLIANLRELKFAQSDNRRVQKLSFVAALFNEAGDFVAGKEGDLNLALKDATYTHFVETGISTRVSILASPGKYRLRGVIEDADGKMTAITQSVEIH